ncbi:MAG: TetR/AcrR family transcriptional regulator [Anaerolineae bacterium]|nr:TetR/AcrR family transcriptional regulator [Anaerolineae bacterium]MCO5189398.1 TetR/AcrR family transcriptional regulator [Anaerolineae bacterium]MCO5203603.1 TetR/AcrR family transcriptional regulator [Anaerolineae bacterium]
MAKQIDDEQVYAATIELLLAKGYAGATTKMIARKAHVNEVTLFRKYGSKAQLVAAALAHERDQMAVDSVDYTGDVSADLMHMVELYHSATPRQSQMMLLIVSDMARYPELRETIQIPFEMVATFSQIIMRYQAEEQLREGDPFLCVQALLGPVIVNTMLRSADAAMRVPMIDLQEHVARFLSGYGN